MNTRSYQLFAKNSFQSIPEFDCPHCHSWKLKLLNEWKILSDEPYSMTQYREETGEIDKSFRFVGILRCNTCWENSSISWIKNSIRNEHPTFIDESWYDEEAERSFIEMRNATWIDYILSWYTYKISYISPSPYIIDIPEELLTSVDHSCILIKEELTKSFELFWIDKDSCANKLRNVLELLLDSLWIPRNGKIQCSDCKKKEDGLLSLERRIKTLSPAISKEMLIVIKLVWNHWSHWTRKISQEDLVKTYKILEHFLVEVFSEKNIALLSSYVDDLHEAYNKPN